MASENFGTHRKRLLEGSDSLKHAKCRRLCKIGRDVWMRSEKSGTLGKRLLDVSDSLKHVKWRRLRKIGRDISMRSENSATLGICFPEVPDFLKGMEFRRLRKMKVGRNSSADYHGLNIFSSSSSMSFWGDLSNFGQGTWSRSTPFQPVETTLRFAKAVPVTHTFGTLPSLPQILVLQGTTADVCTYNNDVMSGDSGIRDVVDWDSMDNAILPGLPDDVGKYCLALVPALNIPTMAVVCKKWRSYVKSKELMSMRKLGGVMEEWLYVLGIFDGEVGGEYDDRQHFGVVHVDGKLIVIGGLDGRDNVILSDVYQYDCRLCSWSKLASMNVARSHFACAEVNGVVYVAGGLGNDVQIFSSVEAYDVRENKWTMMDSGLRRVRFGCTGSSLDGKLYVMGGTILRDLMRAPSAIDSQYIEIYDPKKHVWHEAVHDHKTYDRSQKVHGVMENKLYMLGEVNEEKVLHVFNAEDNSWEVVPIPIQFSIEKIKCAEWVGILNGKVLVFLEDNTLVLSYDPHASSGPRWQAHNIRPSSPSICSLRPSFCSVTGRA